MVTLTSPPTAAVVVAMAGTILPAIRFVLNRSAFSILYILARKFYKGNYNVFLWHSNDKDQRKEIIFAFAQSK